MNTERRDQWKCCMVWHGGDGPETTPWFVILGVHDITAEEAAQCYAEERMGDADNDRDYGDGDNMHVAVEIAPGRAQVFRCRKKLTVSINVIIEGERTDLIQIPPVRERHLQ